MLEDAGGDGDADDGEHQAAEEFAARVAARCAPERVDLCGHVRSGRS